MKEIKLTRGMVALVDNEDFEMLNKYKWNAHREKNSFYALRTDKNRKVVRMHRVVLGLTRSDESIVDHKNHDGLNNQKSNLRLCTIAENNRNQKPRGVSKYKGVHKSDLKHITKKGIPRVYEGWKSEIAVNGKKLHIGRFKTENEAAIAYNEKAKVLHGEFANLNIIIA